MADIPVKKKSSSWWIWLIALLILAVVAWFLFAAADEEVAVAPVATEPVPATPPPAAVIPPPITTPPAGEAAVTTPAPAAAAGGPITDASTYAATQDKLSLVGRNAELTNARVTAVVGPNTFRIATGGEDLYVMLAEDLAARGVGTQGQIDEGDMLNVTGSFQRLAPEEISDIANSRFRDLTEAGRAVLRERQVYLNATNVSKVS